MASKSKLSHHEKHKGESALSEFAEYVEQQQALRYPSAAARRQSPRQTPGSSPTANKVAGGAERLDDLDDIFDNIDLSGSPGHVRLRDIFLSPDGADALQHLVKLLDVRLAEGSGETVFEIGSENNGDSMELTKEEWEVAYTRLAEAAKKLKADCQILLTKNVNGEFDGEPTKDGCSGKVMVRRERSVDETIETRIAVVGNVDAGKSSMLGVLVKGDLDDGRGKARVNLFRHKHEIETGRTSSVGMEIMGFDTKGQVVVSDTPGRKLSWEEIGKRSAKVITFTDLAGHERYLRTTVFGMLSSSPNYCLLMVAANNGLIGMSKEHLGIAVALNIPLIIVITKIDICPPQILEQTIKQITRILKSPGAKKVPVFIKSHEECVNTATHIVSQRICPIFQVSNVTGENLDLIRTFLNILPHHGRYDAEARFEFHVNDTFSVPHVGTVVSGIVKSGVIHAGDEVMVGPDSLGHFTQTSIRSIERKRIGVPAASAGQSASFALRRMRRKDVRKGMVVLPKGEQPKVYREFVAEVLILSHATTIKPKYQAMLHVGPVSQTCAIIDVDRPFIRTGDRALVAFRFVQRPEYLAPGDKLLFREGRTKGLGIVKSVGYDPEHPLTRVDDNQEEAKALGAAEGAAKTAAAKFGT